MSDNEKINWTPELLAEVRNEKGVVLGMMSDEARMALRANREHAERFMSDGWIGRPVDESWHIDSRHFAYRLSPSYTPPELEPKPYVDCPVKLTASRAYFFIRHDGGRWELSDAVDFADFAGFVYDGGAVCTACRLPGLKEGPFSAPIAVRFWTGTGGAK